MAKSLLILLFSFSSFSSELKVGDILLQPLHCRLCNLIEGETRSEYSHIGIVLQTKPSVYVGEAFQKVRAVPLKRFLEKTQKKKLVKVIRSYQRAPFHLLKKIFIKDFQNRPYDSQFLWGEDSFYCSELTWKLLRRVTKSLPKPRPMTYDYRTEEWEKYFKGPAPAGKIGIAPAHFERSRFFKTMGYIDKDQSGLGKFVPSM